MTNHTVRVKGGKILQTISQKKSALLQVCLLLTIILVGALSCAHNSSSNFEDESEEVKPEIASTRNPNIVIQSPATFRWLSESLKAYNETDLKSLPPQETIQEAIVESLTGNGYQYKKSIYTGKTFIKRKRKETNIDTKDLILVKDWKWASANFGGAALLREITLDNRSNQDVKDLRIRIGYLGTKGAKQGYYGPTSIFFIHDLLPAKSVKTFRNINAGFRHPDESKENMSVLSAKTITDDLLVGYYLTTQDEITDQDINKIHDVRTNPSQNKAKINEYKKGTLIIDVVDAKTRASIWRGATLALERFHISENTKQSKIRSAAEKLIADFLMSNQKAK